jgi:hypothetical protein
MPRTIVLTLTCINDRAWDTPWWRLCGVLSGASYMSKASNRHLRASTPRCGLRTADDSGDEKMWHHGRGQFDNGGPHPADLSSSWIRMPQSYP